MDGNDSNQLFPVMSGIGAHSMPHNGTQTDDIQNYLLRLVWFTSSVGNLIEWYFCPFNVSSFEFEFKLFHLLFYGKCLT